jgi:hypothetical protein
MKKLFLFLLITPYLVFAGITGKISGRVIDAKTREPIPSVNIVIEGTSLGTATHIDGFYVINNVPPGVYTLVVSASR